MVLIYEIISTQFLYTNWTALLTGQLFVRSVVIGILVGLRLDRGKKWPTRHATLYYVVVASGDRQGMPHFIIIVVTLRDKRNCNSVRRPIVVEDWPQCWAEVYFFKTGQSKSHQALVESYDNTRNHHPFYSIHYTKNCKSEALGSTSPTVGQ